MPGIPAFVPLQGKKTVLTSKCIRQRWPRLLLVEITHAYNSCLTTEIRKCILAGRIEDAIALLDRYFPTVLDVDLDEVVKSQSEYFSAATHSTVSPTSVEPAHLLLNLHIQDFIESARTISLPYYCPDCRRSLRQGRPASAAGHPECGARAGFRAVRSKGRPALLSKARQLFMEAKRLLSPADRMVYLGKLAQVTAVISYAQPEQSDLAPLFSQAQRDAVADQIEHAIRGMFQICGGKCTPTYQ